MDENYQRILRESLIKYRKDNDLRQSDLADILYCSYSQISKIESGIRQINFDFAELINKELNLNLIVDKKVIFNYEKLFDSLLNAYIEDDFATIIKCIKILSIEKRSILNSLCKYRFYYYELICKLYNNEIKEEDFTLYNKYLNYISDKELWLFYDILCQFYIFKYETSNAIRYLHKALEINIEKCKSISLIRLIKIKFIEKEHKEIINLCDIVIDLLKTNKLKKRIFLIKLNILIILTKNNHFSLKDLIGSNHDNSKINIIEFIQNYKDINNIEELFNIIISVQLTDYSDISNELFVTYLYLVYLGYYQIKKSDFTNGIMDTIYINPYLFMNDNRIIQKLKDTDNIYANTILKYKDVISTSLKYDL